MLQLWWPTPHRLRVHGRPFSKIINTADSVLSTSRRFERPRAWVLEGVPSRANTAPTALAPETPLIDLTDNEPEPSKQENPDHLEADCKEVI